MRKVGKIVILVLCVGIVHILAFNWFTEEKIDDGEKIVVPASIEQDKTSKQEPIQVEEDAWSEEQGGYKVIAKLEIPKIKLFTNVLEECSDRSLLVSVGKFWGADPNFVGNFCVAGHNYYKRKNMFYHLKELKEDDVIYVTDTKNNRLEYRVYDVSKVEPDDVSCLWQDTNGVREITLITCTSDSKMRIVVKAREVE